MNEDSVSMSEKDEAKRKMEDNFIQRLFRRLSFRSNKKRKQS